MFTNVTAKVIEKTMEKPVRMIVTAFGVGTVTGLVAAKPVAWTGKKVVKGVTTGAKKASGVFKKAPVTSEEVVVEEATVAQEATA